VARREKDERMAQITVEHLQSQIERMQFLASVTMPVWQLVPLLQLAMRAVDADSETIETLNEVAGEVRVKLSGDEIRMILGLALQAKLNEVRERPPLRLVYSAAH
jgi:hypothetical protein